jgi:hypothetical protein
MRFSWLQEKGIPFAERSFKAFLILPLTTHHQERGETISLVVVSSLNRILVVYRLGLPSTSLRNMP